MVYKQVLYLPHLQTKFLSHEWPFNFVEDYVSASAGRRKVVKEPSTNPRAS